MKKRLLPNKIKLIRHISPVSRVRLSTAMASLFAVFLIVGGFTIGGIHTAHASGNITPDSTATSHNNEPTEEVVASSVVPSISETEDEELGPVETVAESATPPDTVIIDTAQIMQNPELPNGCEITALASALIACGYPVDKLQLADNYLPQSQSYWGADPEKVYMGNPRHSSANPGGHTQGWYCYEGPILEAANRYLAEQGSLMRARAEKLERETIFKKLTDGIPVVSWVTIDMASPRHSSNSAWNDENGQWFVPYVNVHCVLVIGYNLPLNEVAIMDPMTGFRTENMDTFFSVYEQMGSRSVTIEYS